MSTPDNSMFVEVVLLPLPAQGHLNQLLHLGHRLSTSYNLPVHFVSTAAHIRQAKLRLHGWDECTTAGTLHFHEFQIPDFESPALDPNSANKFPSHLQPLFRAISHFRQPLTALLRRLSGTCGRVVVIHDVMMSSMLSDVSSIHNIESYILHTVSAFCTFWYIYDALERPFPVDEDLLSKVPSMEDFFSPEFMELIETELKYLPSTSGNLFDSCRVIEGTYLDYMETLLNKRTWAIGPFHPVEKKRVDGGIIEHDCMKWLDNQEPKSVIYVSFGTTVSLPEEQIRELATGLEESGLKFLWVVRDADRADLGDDPISEKVGNLTTSLGSDYEERVKGRGIVVRNWAPQLRILGHSAIGGFLSHCGWNSCLESLSMGIPISTWPMHSDQPRNAVLMTDVLRVGLVAKDWSRRTEIVRAPVISEVLKRLMTGEEGKEARRRAEEIEDAVRDAVFMEGGGATPTSTPREMDAFVMHVTRAA